MLLNGYVFPSPCLKHEGFFSHLYHDNLVEFLQVTLMKISSLTLGPQEFLILKLVCTQPPEIYQSYH